MDITSELPDECIANIISKTSPHDACRMSLVSRTFSSAAASNLVWEALLPPDHQQIISESVSSSSSLSTMLSKKDLYFSLCDNPILIGNGNRSFTIHKWSGKKSYMLGARELGVIWGDASQYWKWSSLAESPLLPKSRFSEVAHLVEVCWLHVWGNIETKILSPNTRYGAYLIYTIGDQFNGLEKPVKLSVRFLDEIRCDFINAYLLSRTSMDDAPEEEDAQFPRDREDMWMEIEMGEFFNHDQVDRVVEMELRETEVLNWKSGLVIHGIEVRPKDLR
ncbi:F-box protein At2g02240-like [Juglans microcarpa x Juglans regia]|uniref:F-box protein At2g02240-like n=1 Tax=Juglans microcarpa x Juglans regia TaxID=2249226 RepID=UPI001B7EDB6A|nr:F-box protein At2g02240-like [Juglans microcarpa x Juglans regia]